jgi:hypothetical protein
VCCCFVIAYDARLFLTVREALIGLEEHHLQERHVKTSSVTSLGGRCCFVLMYLAQSLTIKKRSPRCLNVESEPGVQEPMLKFMYIAQAPGGRYLDISRGFRGSSPGSFYE